MELPRIYRYVPKDELFHKGHMVKGISDREEECIYINSNQSDKERLITGVHEMLHYIFPRHKEKRIEKNSVLIGEVLWRLGYRSKIKKRYGKKTKNRLSKNFKGSSKRI